MTRSKSLLGAVPFALLARAQSDPNDDDYQCLSSLHAYDSSSASYANEVITTYITVSTIVDVITNTDVPLTTLCDGRPRALESYTTIVVTTTETYDPPVTSTYQRGTYDGPYPTCTIAETACTPILSSYSSVLSEYYSNDAPYPTDIPHCETTDPASPSTTSPTTSAPDYVSCGTSVSNCFIYANGDYTLYYWPVITVSGDFCAHNGTTVTPPPTDPAGLPNTVVIDGNSFTSPTNYLSWGLARAYLRGRRPSATACGPQPEVTHENFIVPITAPFSSARGISMDGGTFDFNFADLNTPIPTSAWDGQRQCRLEGRCDTIEGAFTPIVPLPTEIANLEPAWIEAGCMGTQAGYYLTPVPLGPTPDPYPSATPVT